MARGAALRLVLCIWVASCVQTVRGPPASSGGKPRRDEIASAVSAILFPRSELDMPSLIRAQQAGTLVVEEFPSTSTVLQAVQQSSGLVVSVHSSSVKLAYTWARAHYDISTTTRRQTWPEFVLVTLPGGGGPGDLVPFGQRLPGGTSGDDSAAVSAGVGGAGGSSLPCTRGSLGDGASTSSASSRCALFESDRECLVECLDTSLQRVSLRHTLAHAALKRAGLHWQRHRCRPMALGVKVVLSGAAEPTTSPWTT